MYNEPAYTHHLDSTFTQILLHLFHLFLLFVFAVSAEAQDFKANLGLHASNYPYMFWCASQKNMESFFHNHDAVSIPRKINSNSLLPSAYLYL